MRAPETPPIAKPVVTRDDGSFCMHLHPSGSINMAAQMRFEHAEGAGGSSLMPDGFRKSSLRDQ